MLSIPNNLTGQQLHNTLLNRLNSQRTHCISILRGELSNYIT